MATTLLDRSVDVGSAPSVLETQSSGGGRERQRWIQQDATSAAQSWTRIVAREPAKCGAYVSASVPSREESATAELSELQAASLATFWMLEDQLTPKE
jgi:hypothetical protein